MESMSDMLCVKELAAEVLTLTYTNISAKETLLWDGNHDESASLESSRSDASSPVATEDEEEDSDVEDESDTDNGDEFAEGEESDDHDDTSEEEDSHEDEDVAADSCEDAQDSSVAEVAYHAEEYQIEDEDEAILKATIASLTSPAQQSQDVERQDKSARSSSMSVEDHLSEDESESDDQSPEDAEYESEISDSEEEAIFHENRFAALAPSEDEDESVSSQGSNFSDEDAIQDSSARTHQRTHKVEKVHQHCGGLVGHMTESMQKGLTKVKAKSEMHSIKMSKTFAYAERRAKGMATSTRKKVTAFFTNPFRFGAETEAKAEA